MALVLVVDLFIFVDLAPAHHAGFPASDGQPSDAAACVVAIEQGAYGGGGGDGGNARPVVKGRTMAGMRGRW